MMDNMRESKRVCFYSTLIAVMSVALLFAALMAYMPQARSAIVRMAEMFLVKRDLNLGIWNARLLKWSKAGVLLLAVCIAMAMALYLGPSALCDKKDSKAVLLFYGFAVANVVLISMTLVNKSVWYDETCTLSTIRHSYWWIVNFLAKYDVHCPLYFFITKFIVDAVHLVFRGADTIVLAKISSIIPIALMIPLAATLVKRHWGRLCGAYFAMCATGMPMIMRFAVEIRMYSYLMLFVTLTFLYAYDCAASASPPPTRDEVGCFLRCAELHRATRTFLAVCLRQ